METKRLNHRNDILQLSHREATMTCITRKEITSPNMLVMIPKHGNNQPTKYFSPTKQNKTT